MECALVGLATDKVVCLDYHDVIDTWTWEECCDMGVALDHADVTFGVVSYGRDHCEATLTNHTTYPMIVESNFVIFTDYRQLWSKASVYRPEGYPKTCIRMKADKGTVCSLAGGPVAARPFAV